MYTPRGGSINSIEVNKYWAFPVAPTVRNLPAVRETWVQSLGQEEPRKRNDNPPEYSCLENPMDRRAWWATVQGVTKRVGHDWATNTTYLQKTMA